jgi:predicted secreted protein
MRYRRRVAQKIHSILFFLLFAVVSAAPKEQPPAVDTTLCSLAAHPKMFNNKRVRTSAAVQSSVIEGGTWLIDTSCAGEAVELSIPDQIRNNPEQHQGFKALDDAIRRRGNIGTVGKKITATFIGKFISRSKAPKRTLVLEKVENLRVAIEKE